MNDNGTLGAIKRRWWIILLFAVVGAVAGALPEPERVEDRERVFRATHTLLLNETDPLAQTQSAVSPNQLTLFATTGEVPARAAEALAFSGNPATLASQVEAGFDQISGALTLSSTQADPARAEEVADTFADALVAYLTERQDFVYQERVASSLQRLTDAETELNRVSNELITRPDDPVLQAQQAAISRQYSVAFEQAEQLAEVPTTLGLTTLQRAQAVEVTDFGLGAPRSRPSRALLGAAMGAALGVAVAVVLGRLDRRIRSREQAEEVTELRARVAIPKVRAADRDGVVVVSARHDPLSDAYRTVRNLVTFLHTGDRDTSRAQITLVVSPSPGDGKTSLAVNLAAALAENGRRTVLVNTDFRRPRLAKALGPAAEAPLPFDYEDVRSLGVRALVTRSGVSNLRVLDLSAIDATAVELLGTTVDKLPQLARMCDHIVIDSSPIGVTAEVLDVVPHADTIVMLNRVGHTKIAPARRAVSMVRDLSTAPILLVLSGVRQDRNEYYEYGGRPSSVPAKVKRSRRRGTDGDAESEDVAEVASADAAVSRLRRFGRSRRAREDETVPMAVPGAGTARATAGSDVDDDMTSSGEPTPIGDPFPHPADDGWSTDASNEWPRPHESAPRSDGFVVAPDAGEPVDTIDTDGDGSRDLLADEPVVVPAGGPDQGPVTSADDGSGVTGRADGDEAVSGGQRSIDATDGPDDDVGAADAADPGVDDAAAEDAAAEDAAAGDGPTPPDESELEKVSERTPR